MGCHDKAKGRTSRAPSLCEECELMEDNLEPHFKVCKELPSVTIIRYKIHFDWSGLCYLSNSLRMYGPLLSFESYTRSLSVNDLSLID